MRIRANAAAFSGALARTAQLPLVLVLFAAAGWTVTGCDPVTEARARQVADAWDGSEAARAWRKGYHPIGEAVELPEGAFRNVSDKRAYGARNFTLRGQLPAASGKNGRVKWESGGSLTLPLMEARQAYEAVARGSNNDRT